MWDPYIPLQGKSHLCRGPAGGTSSTQGLNCGVLHKGELSSSRSFEACLGPKCRLLVHTHTESLEQFVRFLTFLCIVYNPKHCSSSSHGSQKVALFSLYTLHRVLKVNTQYWRWKVNQVLKISSLSNLKCCRLGKFDEIYLWVLTLLSLSKHKH